MQEIRIVSRDEGKKAETEFFLDRTLKVISRSGLSSTEAALIEQFPNIGNSGDVLIVGNRTGVIGMLLSGAKVVMQIQDVHFAKTAERNLYQNQVSHVSIRCEPYIQERGFFDTVVFQNTKGDMSGELFEDFLQQVQAALKPNGVCWLATDEDPGPLMNRLQESFGNATAAYTSRKISVLKAIRKKELEKERIFEAEFQMTLPGGIAFPLLTIPGVFTHRRVDAGGLALAEVADVLPGDKVVDMGCGSGAVGIALSKKQSLEHITFVDSNVRATFITGKNCQLNGLSNCDVVLSDCGPVDDRKYSLFVGNPPYFGDYRIAEMFIHTAVEHLLPGGRAYIVAKNSKQNCDLMQHLFGNAEIIRRRGYEVVRSVKP